MKFLKHIIPVVAVIASFLGDSNPSAEAQAIPAPIVIETTTTSVPTTLLITTLKLEDATSSLVTTTTQSPTTSTVVTVPVTSAPPITVAPTTTEPPPPAPPVIEGVMSPYDTLFHTLFLLAGTSQYIPTWKCIANSESRNNQTARSSTNDWGFLQINGWWWQAGGFKNLASAGWISWETYDFLMQADRFDPIFQAWAADAIWRSSGKSWRQWSVHFGCGV